MATIVAKAGSGNWNKTTSWVGGVEPKAGDTAVIPVGATITVTAAAACATLEVTGGTLKVEKTLSINAEAGTVLMKNTAGTIETTGAGQIKLKVNGGVTATITTAGLDLGKVAVEGSGTSKYKLEDAVTCGTELLQQNGVFDFNGKGGTLKKLAQEAGCTLKGGTGGTIKVTGTECSFAGTVEAGTAVLELTGTTAGGSRIKFATTASNWASTLLISVDNVELSVGTNEIETIEGNPTAGTIKTLFGSVGIMTVKAITRNGTTNKWQMVSTSKGTKWHISKASGAVELDYVEIEDSKAEGGASWKAGAHSVNLGNNEGWTFTSGATREVSDTITVSDGISVAGTRARTVSDTVTVSDAATASSTHVAAVADTVTVSDTAAAVSAHARSVADTVSVSDAAAANVGRAPSVSDSVSVSDTVSGTAAHSRSVSDTLSVADTASAAGTRSRTVEDTVSVSDAAAAGGGRSRSCSDTLSVSDTASATSSRTRMVADTVTISDSATASSVQARTVSDTVTVSDSAAGLRTILRTPEDTVTVSDSVSVGRSFVRATADTVTVTDGASCRTIVGRVVFDVVVVSDSATAVVHERPTSADVELVHRPGALIELVHRPGALITVRSHP